MKLFDTIKKCFYLIVIFSIFFSIFSCRKKPEISFSSTNDTVGVRQLVKFTNTTIGASKYFWDFGDGAVSSDESPTHTFTKAGTYKVSLTAYTKWPHKSNVSTYTITVSEWVNIKPNISDFCVNGSSIYAIGDNHIYLSKDTGATWETLTNSGLPSQWPINNITVLNNSVYVGTFFLNAPGGIEIYKFNGASWNQVLSAGQGFYCSSYLFSNATNIFTSTCHFLYTSNDNANNWTVTNAGSPISSYNFYQNKIITGEYAYYGSGVNISTDNGMTWNHSDAGFANNSSISSVGIGISNYFATDNNNKGLYVSTDGLNWTVNPSMSTVTGYSFCNQKNKIYLSTDQGVYVSENDGNDWITIDNYSSEIRFRKLGFCGDKIIGSGSSNKIVGGLYIHY